MWLRAALFGLSDPLHGKATTKEANKETNVFVVNIMWLRINTDTKLKVDTWQLSDRPKRMKRKDWSSDHMKCVFATPTIWFDCRLTWIPIVRYRKRRTLDIPGIPDVDDFEPPPVMATVLAWIGFDQEATRVSRTTVLPSIYRVLLYPVDSARITTVA